MELARIVEALIFAAPEPLSAKDIARTVRRALEDSVDPGVEELKKTTPAQVQTAIDELSEVFTETGRSLQFAETAQGWRLYSRPEFAGYIRALLPDSRPERLSPPALETLAIIAYRQPITKADIEAVRGVSVDGVLQKVIDRGLVKIGGRADLPGRPLLYETSDTFLDHFGIKNLDDLPNSGELRNIALPSAADQATEEQMTLGETAKPEEDSDQKSEEQKSEDETPKEADAEAEETSPSDTPEENEEEEAESDDDRDSDSEADEPEPEEEIESPEDDEETPEESTEDPPQETQP